MAQVQAENLENGDEVEAVALEDEKDLQAVKAEDIRDDVVESLTDVNEAENEAELVVEKNGHFSVGNIDSMEENENAGAGSTGSDNPSNPVDAKNAIIDQESESIEPATVVQNEGLDAETVLYAANDNAEERKSRNSEDSVLPSQSLTTVEVRQVTQADVDPRNKANIEPIKRSSTTTSGASEKSRTLQMIEDARKAHAMKVKKDKEAASKQQEELRKKEERNREVFEEWCRQKDEEERNKKEKERKEKEKLYQDMSKDDKEEQARRSFNDWVKEKDRQAQQDKLMQEYKRQEEQSVLYTRTQEDSDAAFRKWLKQKKRQEEDQVKLIRQRNKRIEKLRQRWEKYNYRSFFDNTAL